MSHVQMSALVAAYNIRYKASFLGSPLYIPSALSVRLNGDGPPWSFFLCWHRGTLLNAHCASYSLSIRRLLASLITLGEMRYEQNTLIFITRRGTTLCFFCSLYVWGLCTIHRLRQADSWLSLVWNEVPDNRSFCAAAHRCTISFQIFILRRLCRSSRANATPGTASALLMRYPLTSVLKAFRLILFMSWHYV